jgi:transposase-like protein
MKSVNHYPDDFKLKVIREVVSGQLTKEAAQRKYLLGGNSAVLIWMRKFGIENKPISKDTTFMNLQKKTHTKVETADMSEVAALKKKIKELELQLEYERLRTEALDTLINLAETRFNVPIRKKPGAKQSRS